MEAIEQELAGLIRTAGNRIPLASFRFRGAVGEAALKALRSYQVLPVRLRRYRIEKRREHYKSTESFVLVQAIPWPGDWVRPLQQPRSSKSMLPKKE